MKQMETQQTTQNSTAKPHLTPWTTSSWELVAAAVLLHATMETTLCKCNWKTFVCAKSNKLRLLAANAWTKTNMLMLAAKECPCSRSVLLLVKILFAQTSEWEEFAAVAPMEDRKFLAVTHVQHLKFVAKEWLNCSAGISDVLFHAMMKCNSKLLAVELFLLGELMKMLTVRRWRGSTWIS